MRKRWLNWRLARVENHLGRLIRSKRLYPYVDFPLEHDWLSHQIRLYTRKRQELIVAISRRK